MNARSLYRTLCTRTITTVAIVAVPLGVLVVLFVAPSWGKKQNSPRLVYAAGVAANTLIGSESCYEKVGIYAGLDAKRKQVQPIAELRKLASRNRPTAAVVQIGSKRYRLAVDTATSGVYRQHVTWNFRTIKDSKNAIRKLIGKKAVISYTIGQRSYKTKPVKVVSGRCQ